MLEAIIYGFGTGIVLSLMLGTVFFALIQNSVDYGYKSGVLISLGVVFSDILFISGALLGTSFLPTIPNLSFYTSLVGGGLLIVLGAISILKKDPKIAYPKTKFGNIVYYFTTGFLLNVLNPVNFFFWVAIATKLTGENYTQIEKILFFVGCLLAIFSTEVGIAFSASKLRKLFTAKVLRSINVVSGIVFVGFGIKLLYDAFTKY
ncbi:MAG: LysE family translocator [Raineya sp.]|jgi:threonine/homoserine/homoserine lactone efflux protein|nr:LysE family translocator [Raineya sp.]